MAHEFLDCDGKLSVTWRVQKKGRRMNRLAIEPAITIILSEVHTKLNEAARIARAAEACAIAGSIGKGVLISMDIEQLLYEANRLHDAASLLNRLSAQD